MSLSVQPTSVRGSFAAAKEEPKTSETKGADASSKSSVADAKKTDAAPASNDKKTEKGCWDKVTDFFSDSWASFKKCMGKLFYYLTCTMCCKPEETAAPAKVDDAKKTEGDKPAGDKSASETKAS